MTAPGDRAAQGLVLVLVPSSDMLVTGPVSAPRPITPGG
jgi:hypothetical protein